ncbi:hypothetical protein HYPBUDRAFT_242056 [Hyphopichia burtonii NRRL Y-1933]|uniref:Uncharacterized protein n=1 Tax=Hyphopichia burtonii NRRL Y-1933 TaxID=984485 RepID=A0A1E4RH27_9ASCO|nr:hypothetical protein HYPBUDRAFT_242056 [Hyphopichia burtonii NRRL Y-1933]ODV66516.1 hypothetical protein HYPBUDRAFT_242056 [Hyphopichia burtonii NRRL Y-1933]
MASPIFLSNPPPGFSIVAILRGIQLALLGAYRSLQNPKLFESKYYQQAFNQLKYSIILQCILWAPILTVRFFFQILALIFRHDQDLENIVSGLEYFQKNVLNIGVFIISAIRFFTPELDDLFLTSLKFIDSVYIEKHPDRKEHQYHDNLIDISLKLTDLDYNKTGKKIKQSWFKTIQLKYQKSGDFSNFVKRYLYNCSFNILIYILCKVPKIGTIIIGLISFQNFNDKVGSISAIIIFFVLQLLPKHYTSLFLSIFWGSRNMIHDLLLPYFIRIQFTKIEKDQWMKSREGVLFGFGLCYYYIIYQLPWISVFVYGIAESSVAYLITKVSDPPPNQLSQLINWNSTQLVWNKDDERKVLGGGFADQDEGFKPIPGSFIVDPNLKKND